MKRKTSTRSPERANPPRGGSVGAFRFVGGAAKRRSSYSAGAATMQVADIKVGKRHRRDMGDIAALAESIEDIGLLHPITVDEKNRLLAGARRLAACKLLGWKTVPVNVVRCM
jgi:ParB-like nuclease domain